MRVRAFYYTVWRKSYRCVRLLGRVDVVSHDVEMFDIDLLCLQCVGEVRICNIHQIPMNVSGVSGDVYGTRFEDGGGMKKDSDPKIQE